jgi:hypothetical protein
MSGSGDELRNFEGISAAAIVKTVKRLITSERVSPTRLIANLGDMNRLGWVDRAARRNTRA